MYTKYSTVNDESDLRKFDPKICVRSVFRLHIEEGVNGSAADNHRCLTD